MPYLTPDDFTSRTYAQKLNAISKGDVTLLPVAISEAEAEAKLYLSRFDLADLFGKAGDDRDPILLRWLKDISLWQFIGLANPGLDYEDCELRRNNAITGLKAVQGSTGVPEGWLLLTAAAGTSGNPGATWDAVSQQCKRDTYR